ncbi:MAG: hypothetical protein A2W85_18675 [Bacteroidetes bacterium GWF2_41_31]|nr:MAG: hypothetical protein A2W85_18675 [Bacteroidetes bacterium GWF2_41_31]OFZ09119.1 MAG: hypothetical protein A2338_07410 [Bacteroidetes bacterium RIFOXYB12_FULL_41_6]
MDNGFKINRWLRYSYGFYLGIIFNFILDIIFSLVYKNYPLFQPINNYLISIFLTYAVFEILFFFNKRLKTSLDWDQHPAQRFLLQFLSNSLIAIILVMVLRWGVRFLLGRIDYIALADEIIIGALVVTAVLIAVVSELSVFLLNKWRFSLAELERFKKENAEYRFELLRSQLNPHFLFNSLNTLSSLIYENQENAGHFVRELADVYRYILENRDKELILLSNELEFAKSYINLVQLRFDKNLEVILDLQHNNPGFRIAPLTIQLLIENAIKHNVISRKNPLQIDIFIEDKMLVVKNSILLKHTKEFSTELGLKNISNRYGFLTDRTIEIFNSGENFVVKIPLI